MTHNITERDDTLYTHEFVRCLTPHSIYALKKEGVKKDELIWKEKEQFAVKGELPEITELKYRDFLVGRQTALQRVRETRSRLITGKRSALLGLSDPDADVSPADDVPEQKQQEPHREKEPTILPHLVTVNHSISASPSSSSYSSSLPLTSPQWSLARLLSVQEELAHHPAARILQKQRMKQRQRNVVAKGSQSARVFSNTMPATSSSAHTSYLDLSSYVNDSHVCSKLRNEYSQQQERIQWETQQAKIHARNQRRHNARTPSPDRSAPSQRATLAPTSSSSSAAPGGNSSPAAVGPLPPSTQRFTRAQFLRFIGPGLAAEHKKQQQLNASSPSLPPTTYMGQNNNIYQHGNGNLTPLINNRGSSVTPTQDDPQSSPLPSTSLNPSSTDPTTSTTTSTTSQSKNKSYSDITKAPSNFDISWRDQGGFEEKLALKYRHYYEIEEMKFTHRQQQVIEEIKRSEKLKLTIMNKQEENYERRIEKEQAMKLKRQMAAIEDQRKRLEKYDRVAAAQVEKQQIIEENYKQNMDYHEELYAEQVRARNYVLFEKMRTDQLHEEECAHRAKQEYYKKLKNIKEKQEAYVIKTKAVEERQRAIQAEQRSKVGITDELVDRKRSVAYQRHEALCHQRIIDATKRAEKHANEQAIQAAKVNAAKQQKYIKHQETELAKQQKRDEYLLIQQELFDNKISKIFEKDSKDEARLKQLEYEKECNHAIEVAKKRIEFERFQRNLDREERKKSFAHYELENKHKEAMERLKQLNSERDDYAQKREEYMKHTFKAVADFKNNYKKIQTNAINQLDRESRSKKVEKQQPKSQHNVE